MALLMFGLFLTSCGGSGSSSQRATSMCDCVKEAVELVIEAKDSNDELFKNEAADLLYHLLILLKAKDQSFSSIERVLKSRSMSKN